jgi:dephospho-CoA kinase
MKKKVIGVIGAIGAGKSTVAQRLEELGGRLIDGDAVGHRVLREPEIRSRIVERFGEGVVGTNGEIDRKKLGSIVFSDKSLLDELEAIMHPRMKRIFAEEIADAQSDPIVKLIVFDAAILLEADWGGLMDEILYVDADRRLREERVKSRGWSPAELARREQAQWPAEKKKAHADHVIVNDVWESRRWEVDALFRRWTATEDAGRAASISDRSSSPASEFVFGGSAPAAFAPGSPEREFVSPAADALEREVEVPRPNASRTTSARRQFDRRRDG